ncbi:MAG: hypothetical protein ACRCX1_12225 [Bacteroidales bacterium]
MIYVHKGYVLMLGANVEKKRSHATFSGKNYQSPSGELWRINKSYVTKEEKKKHYRFIFSSFYDQTVIYCSKINQTATGV